MSEFRLADLVVRLFYVQILKSDFWRFGLHQIGDHHPKEAMHFGTFSDRNGLFFDTVHFPPVVKKFPFRGYGIYLLSGKVVEEFGFASLEVKRMEKLPLKKDPRFV